MEHASARVGDWDMTSYFPVFGGAEYQAFIVALNQDITLLQTTVSQLPTDMHMPEAKRAWVDALVQIENVSARFGHVRSYLGCLGAADARNNDLKRDSANLAMHDAELEKIMVSIRSRVGAWDEAQFQQLCAETQLKDVSYFLQRLREQARFSMSADREALAADLGVTGLSAWGRLYDDISGNLMFDMQYPDGRRQPLSVSVTRSLLEDPDPHIRRAALRGSNQAWERVAQPLSACLNAISGTRLTLYRGRKIQHFLEPALFDANISRRTLDTMFDVVTSRRAIARDYLRTKARMLSKPQLGFSDLMAPLPRPGSRRIPWPEARQRVLKAFASFYPRLAEFAEMAFDKRWIDHSLREGKRPGGFCSSSYVNGESRVFMTYNGALGDIQTLAHELGHAYHAWVMRDMRPWARHYPMTLAETASTFAEQVVIDSVLHDEAASTEEKELILDNRLQDGAVFLLNIPMRFIFEKALYEERAHGELSVSRLKEIMLQAQRDCYGDCLADDELDPWFWASKLHFYITDISFYNFPYTFGYLFSQGIFARGKREGPQFFDRYEQLLRLTGSDTAEHVAKRALGIDLTSENFWHEAIDLLEDDLKKFR